MMGGKKEKAIRVRIRKWTGCVGEKKRKHLETVTFMAGDRSVDLEKYLGENGVIPCYSCEFRHRRKSYSTRYSGPRDNEGILSCYECTVLRSEVGRRACNKLLGELGVRKWKNS